MWIGLLTPGAHPGRPPATEHVATLFSWTREGRARIDGPPEAVDAGLRMMRAATDLGPAFAPRCFTCLLTYRLPDPAEVRGLDDADVRTLGPDGGEPDGDADASRVAALPGRATFLCVHVDDDAPVGEEGEVIVHVPGTQLVTLVPFGCVAAFASIAAEAYADVEPAACNGCGTTMPGGALGAPSRAARRAAVRRTGGCAARGRRAA